MGSCRAFRAIGNPVPMLSLGLRSRSYYRSLEGSESCGEQKPGIGTQGSSLLNGYEVLGQDFCQILHCFCSSVGQSCSSLCHLCSLEETGFNQHRGKGTFPIYLSDCVYSNHCLILGRGNETLLPADFLLFCFFFAEPVNDDNWNVLLFF
jgi:hypothetical protein